MTERNVRMKYSILSDIHGSYRCLCEGLERFEADNGDMLLLLGDLLYHGPRNPIPDGYDPQRTAPALNQYAVSYTNLDVYKRKILGFRLDRFPIYDIMKHRAAIGGEKRTYL